MTTNAIYKNNTIKLRSLDVLCGSYPRSLIWTLYQMSCVNPDVLYTQS